MLARRRSKALPGRHEARGDEVVAGDDLGRTPACPITGVQRFPRREDEAIAAADTLLLTVPNQLGVDYAHVVESVLTHLTPELGWR